MEIMSGVRTLCDMKYAIEKCLKLKRIRWSILKLLFF